MSKTDMDTLVGRKGETGKCTELRQARAYRTCIEQTPYC